MKTLLPKKAVLLMIIIVISAISNIRAQELVPFTPRETRDNIRGNILMTGNDIVGVLEREDVDYDPNAPFDLFTGNNGPYTTAFIDVDNDPSTFSSSEADLRIYNNLPRESCSSIVYAGLYWSANYYMARDRSVNNFSNDEISSGSNTNVVLIINNGRLAQEYIARYSEFDSDNSDIQFSPVTSYMVVAQPENGCGITNGAQLTGNIAVIRDGGSCSIREKVVNAQNAGAVGVVIVNDNNGLMPRLTGDGPTINIPSVSIGNDDIDNANINNGDLITELRAETNVVLGTLSTEDDDQETGLPLTDPRKDGPADFRNVKFKVPGGSYVDITAENVVWDGYRNTPTNNSDRANDEVQYVCYSDVTSLIDQDNPFGTYTVADMNATNGQTDSSDGACGGWMLVVIYEDPLESAKYISTSDGYVQIFASGDPEEYMFSGFTTLQGNQPVDVRFGSAGLEGDRGLTGDGLQIENTANVFTRLGQGNNNTDDVNPTTNFFASTISFDHQHITDRNPDSENTMGFDADLFDLNNDNNTLIGNNQSDATFRLFTDGDRYSVFFNAFSVTIIEPELRIIKRVYDTDGTTEITGASVELGDQLFYDLEIENIGNEDLVDGTIIITDILPPNTNLVDVQTATLPPGVTFSEVSPGVVEFYIPASLVETPNDGTPGDVPIFIRFRAELVSTCEDLRDACSDIIQNTATATYTGAVSGTPGSTLSSNELGVCGNTDGEASNVLVNVPACQLDVTFCNDDLLLVAGTGYNQYTLTGPGIATPIVQTGPGANVFDVANPQTGTYTIFKEDTDGVEPSCMSLTEEFTVEDFRDITNPVLDYVNGTTVVTEDCSGVPIPQILLCGDQTLLLETNFDPSSLDDISWQRLTPSGSCVLDPNDPCSLLDGNCTDANWVEVTGGDTSDYTVSEAGDYRILAEFDGGCIIPFYFSVFKNDYQPDLTMNPIECGSDGSVSVVNVPTNFAFSLNPGGPYTNTTGIFPISTAGDVTVYAIDTTFPGCEYSETINVPSIDPTFSVTGVDPSCVNDDNGTGFGEIVIGVTGGIPEYQYTISSPVLGAADPIIVPNSSANNGNYTQNNLPAGTYTVEVISNRPTPECVFDATVTINPAPAFDAEVVLLAPETCDSGALVQVNVLNGSGNYLFDNGDGNFVPCNIFEIPSPADPSMTYTFRVSDQNVPSGEPSCVISASIDNITPYEPIVIDNVTLTQPPCPGDTGQIQVDVSPTVAGRLYTYQLWDCAIDPNCGNADQTTWDPTVWTLVNEIASTGSQTITFTGVPDGNSYAVTVLHANTTPTINNPDCTFPVPEANICPVRESVFAITSPIGITADVTLDRPLSCIVGSEDAIIQVDNIAGGSGTYEWSLDNVTFTNITTTPFDILVSTDGSYTIYIRNQGSGDCAAPFTIDVPALIPITAITFAPGDGDCTNQSSDVSFEAQPALSAADIAAGVVYEYDVSPDPATGTGATGNTGFLTTNSYTIAQGITYTITARRSDDQCTFSDDYRVDVIDPIDITNAVETTPVVCVGESNGALSFNVINSTSFDYVVRLTSSGVVVDSGNGITTTPVNVTGLAAGNYTITVTDTNPGGSGSPLNCSDTATVDVTEPATPLTFTTAPTETNCGANTGTITVTANGGRGNYQYRLVNSGGTVIVDYPNTSNIFTGLAADTYTIFVRDGNDPATACEINNTETIIESASPTITLATGGDPCYDGTNQASQWVTIAPGINPPLGPFEYIIDRGSGPETPVAVVFLPAPNDDTFEIDNLAPGSYTVFVRNTNTQCITNTEGFTINQELTITASPDKDIDCNGDAIISFVAVGGSGTYTYEIFREGTPDVSILANASSPYSSNLLTPGDYFVRVVDSQNCSADSNPVTVTAYEAVVATPTPTDPSCNGENGSITVDVTAGEGPFTYVLNGTTTIGPTGDTSVTFNNVPPGTHSVVITDGSGATPPCETTLNNIILTSPDPIVATIDEDFRALSCVAPLDAQAQITAITGGSGSYEYSLDGTTYTPVGAIPFTIDFAADGSYTLYVRNLSTDDCEETFPITIDPLLEVESVTVTPGIEDCTAQTIEVTLSAAPLLTAPVVYDFEVSPNPATNVGGSSTGFNATTNYTFTNGITYRVTARRSDSNCTEFVDFNRPLIDEIEITSAAQSQPVTCNGGNDGALAFNVDTTLFPNFTFEVRGPSPATTLVFSGTYPADPLTVTGLSVGTYTINVTDANGAVTTNCSDTATVTITEPTVITFTPELDQTCNDNTVTVSNETGGNGPVYTYTITHPTNGTSLGPQATTIPFTGILNDATDPYTITVFDTTGVCFGTQTLLITQLPAVTLSITSQELCLDDGLTSVEIEITSGSPDYSYDVTRNGTQIVSNTPLGAGNTTINETFTQSGTYIITVTDSVGCTETETIIIEPAVELVVNQVDIICNAAGVSQDASFSFAVNGGYAPYDIAVSFNSGAFVDHVTNVIAPFLDYIATSGAGTYEFRVTDDRGCTFTTSPFTVTDPAPIAITADDVNVACFGDTGTAIIIVTGTEAPYEIDFENTGTFVTITGTQITFPNLAEGVYDFTVRSARGCLETDTVEIIAPDIISGSGMGNPVTCDDGSGGGPSGNILGSVDLTITGGTGPFTYTLVEASNLFVRPLVAVPGATPSNPIINTPSTSITFGDVDFGQYYVFVEDANGCTDASPFGPFNVFSQISDLQSVVTATATCPGGVVFDVQVLGGAGVNPPADPPPGFEIRIVGEPSPGLGDFVPLNDIPLGPTAVDANTPIRDHRYGGMTAGAFDVLDFNRTYILEVRDLATGCIYQELVAPLAPLSSPIITQNSLSDVSCNVTPAVNDGEITFTVSGYDPGVTSIEWEVFDQITNVSLDVSLAPTVYSGSAPVVSPAPLPVTISNFPPGQYYVVVREGTAPFCPSRFDFVIDIPDPLISIDTNQTPANSCGTNAQVIMDTNGGTPFGIPPTADGYQYALIADDGFGSPVTTPTVLADFPLTSNVIDLGNTVQTLHIFVIDDNGCTFGPVTVNTVVNPLPTVVANFIDDCAYDNSNVIDVDGTGLGTNLLYQIDGGTAVNGSIDNNNHQFIVSTPGTYTITITDDSGCSVSTPVTVYGELVISAEFTVAPDCQNPTGEITTSIDSGAAIGTLTYELQDNTGTPIGNNTGDATGVYTGVAPGEYIVEVTDDGRGTAPFCSFTAPVSIDAPEIPVLVVPAANLSISCNGAADATIVVDLGASFDPDAVYTYEITAPIVVAPQASPIFPNLGPGTYTVVVTATQENGPGATDDVVCTGTADYTVDDVTIPSADVNQVAQFDCDANTNASFEITNIMGGNGPGYTAEITRPDATVISNVPLTLPTTIIEAPIPGIYNVQIFDVNNCPSAVDNVNIAAYTPMSNLLVTQTQAINCQTPPPAGAGDEIVEVSVAGGSGDFLFQRLDNAVDQNVLDFIDTPSGSSLAQFFNLPAIGTYTFRVIDQGDVNGLGLNCDIITTYDVPEFDFMDVNITSSSNLTCFGNNSGSIEFEVTGYTDSFDYDVRDATTLVPVASGNELAGFTNPIVVNGLPAGTFEVFIQELDYPFCDEVSGQVTITQPENLVLTLDDNINANCNENGRVIVSVTGGTPPYTFNDGVNAPVVTSSTTVEFSLPGGPAPGINYNITVTDTNSCPATPVSVDVILTDPPVLNSLTVDDVCMHDGSYVITATGTSNVAAPPGTGALQFQLNGGAIEDANNGLTSTNITVSTPGTYTVIAYDENGCPSNTETITILPELIASADFTVDPTCRDLNGTITVTITGGSDFATNPGNFTFTLRDEGTNAIVAGPQVGNNIFTLIPAGDYIVEISDINIPTITTPCSITIDVPELSVPVDPIVSASANPVSCIGSTDGTVTVALDPATDDDGPYVYQLFVDTGGGVPGAQVGTDQTDNPVFTGLPTGNYVAIVTSDRDCSGQDTVTVPNATQVTAILAQTNYSCNPADNSEIFPTITLTIENGIPPYTVTYVTPSGNTVTVVDVVDANGNPADGIQLEILADEEGDYAFTVTDFNGCNTSPDVTIIETVAPFPIMTNPAVAIVTDITCAVDEEVTVSVQGGSGDFLFELIDNAGTVINPPVPVDTPAGTFTANFILPRPLGIYTFRITDQITMCTITVTHEIDEFDFVELIAAQETPESCLGDADGTINISITGYTGPYNFTILDENGNPTAFSGTGDTTTDPNPYILPVLLPQGVYIVEIVETADPLCTERSNAVAVMGPGAPIVTAISPINTVESCLPGADGSFQASVTGAQGAVTYTLTPGAITNTTGLFENLTAGLYTVTAEDSQGCTDDEQFTIQAPNAIIVDPIADSSVTCFEDTDGSITVVASGGQGPGTYLYTLTFPDGVTTSGPQSIAVFNNLGAGTYTITVSDNLNCTATTTAVINEPNEVTVNIDTVTQVTCDINTIDVTISGTSDVAITEYYYIDQDGNQVANGGSGVFTGLGAGEYQFFVEDVNGCRSQLSSPVPVIPINQIAITLDLSAANINCFNEETAIIDASVTGGIGDYIFELTNNTTAQTWGPQSESEFTNLPPGNYTYLVRSDRNCVSQVDFDIINPAEFENIPPEITDVVCFGEDNGSIIVFATGGTGLYSFAISTDPGQFFNDESDNVPNQHTFTNLVPGVYQVFAQDSNGCGQVYDVTIGEPDQLMANIVGSVTAETCADANDGAVTIDITGGTPPYFTSITNNPGDFVEGLLTYMDLPGGITNIFIRDSNDCPITLPVDIPEGAILNGIMSPRADCPVYNADGTVSQPPVYYIDFVLGDDSVDTDIIYNLVSTDGGISPGDSLSPTFVVQPGEYQGTMTYTPTGCVFDAGLITIEPYVPLLPPVAVMTNNPQDPNEYEIRIGGTEPYNNNYTYFVAIIPNGSTLNDLIDSDYRELDTNIFSIDETSFYALRVVDNSFNDCPITASQELTFINIVIPNYFTPDGDGTNDTWYPRQDPFRDPFFFGNMEVKVFDRYGRLLAEFMGDQGTNNGWDGIYQGSELPSGDYWFTIILNDIDNREFTGHFTLYR
ncbi:T9SS type B sorting domain-containing protein [uncultured Aquimarina sp.]|uniref:T9SS type B sorting domain-containing protein n=1 Tax=uncultured Aquimarina sp. TaxID=575652 RepID=UPI002606A194|nr:T9SS type B sorting domain-containing protein [uncultured Aquimarina sp.]